MLLLITFPPPTSFCLTCLLSFPAHHKVTFFLWLILPHIRVSHLSSSAYLLSYPALSGTCSLDSPLPLLSIWPRFPIYKEIQESLLWLMLLQHFISLVLSCWLPPHPFLIKFLQRQSVLVIRPTDRLMRKHQRLHSLPRYTLGAFFLMFLIATGL